LVSFVFVLSLALIAATTFVIESEAELAPRLRRPAGLLTWLTRGNWPAKVGGVLVIVGLAALLKYALIHIDVPPLSKLVSGVATSLALGLAATLVRGGGARRAVSLALGGAAFGVAYMTAYSAFALFHYLDGDSGLAFLVLTAIAAGAFAITRSALSLALLSMVGAFMSPAFAIDDPGPLVVYGYYLAASLLTLTMVWRRGWRPLIHLSFLFTIAGGLFFAWTAEYYTPQHASVMQPMLLALAAVHVAMPIVERSRDTARWIERLDLVYLIALPLFATLAALGICPDRIALSMTVLALGAIWAVAALSLRAARRDGVLAHAVIAVVLVALGTICRFRDWPWELVSLAFAVAALTVAGRQSTSTKLHNVLAGAIVLFGAIHVLSSQSEIAMGRAFLSGVFLERMLGASLLVVAGVVCRRLRQPLDTVLLVSGACWGAFGVGSELIRLDFATVASILHWSFLAVAGGLWMTGARAHRTDDGIPVLVIAILVTAAWAASSAAGAAAWISLFAAPLALIALAARYVAADDASPGARLFAALSAAAVAVVWASPAGTSSDIAAPQFALLCGVVAAIATTFAGRSTLERSAGWLPQAVNAFGVAFAGLIIGATLFLIARNPWAVALELSCLAGLVLVAMTLTRTRRPSDAAATVCIFGLALVAQANVLRWLGPAGDLTAQDLLAMRAPAIVSLLWATTGSALTVFAIRVGSRRLWVSGAALLVATAVKFVLIDFGALGHLANILAVIAAGGMFLLVGWLAPMPPAGTPQDDAAVTDGGDIRPTTLERQVQSPAAPSPT
jgi:uncharacterized membrane protein